MSLAGRWMSINGMKMKETWTRGISDYVDNNGTATTYNVYVLENGDKFFTRGTVLARSVRPEKRVDRTRFLSRVWSHKYFAYWRNPRQYLARSLKRELASRLSSCAEGHGVMSYAPAFAADPGG
jgi:hypothetical protein